MIELWVLLSVGGAFFQNLRSALQKHMKQYLSNTGATYVRFVYSLPFAVCYLLGLKYIGGYEFPNLNVMFFVYTILGSAAQILFTFLLVWLFSFRNFATGTIFSKTETVQVAILGLVLLGDRLNLGAVIAIFVSLIGVLALSFADSKLTFKTLTASLLQKTTLIGLLCGAALGASVIFFRGATLSLDGDGFLMKSAFALTIAVVIQTIVMGIYIVIKEPKQIKPLVANWRPALWVGVSATLASVFWFAAFTIQNASYVRAVGQIELVFTLIASAIIFKEKIQKKELFGIFCIICGIFILLAT